MTEEFITILKKLIADRGIGILDDAKICHNLLLDYGKGAYKLEIKLFTITLEKGFREKLRNSHNRDLDKRQMAKYWHEDEGVDIGIAEKMLNCLCHVLFNEPLSDKFDVSFNRDSASKIIVPTFQNASVQAVTKSTFTDPRDGKVYKTVKIGKQVWMAENLNYNAHGSKFYDNDPKNGEKYGRLYDWETAKKAVPHGWHLSTNEEWDKLYRYVDGTNGTESPYKSPTAGRYLKATSGWKKGRNGEDTYGFSALPGGQGAPNGGFALIGRISIWWSSTNDNNGYYQRDMIWSDFARWSDDDDSGFLYSVRCVQNYIRM